MSQIKIGPFTFYVLKQDGNRILLSWTESSGIVKERWFKTNAIRSKI